MLGMRRVRKRRAVMKIATTSIDDVSRNLAP
jgi:hypothetical protein